MDIFHEQLVKIKTTPAVIVSKVLMWLAAVLIVAACVVFSLSVTPLLLFLAAGAVYIAYKVNGMLNIEFEYVVTNGIVDIDKIINKSDRKRTVSFECRNIESIVKWNGERNNNTKTYVCCDNDSALCFSVSPENGEKCYVVFAPDSELLNAMKPFIPRAVLKEIGEI